MEAATETEVVKTITAAGALGKYTLDVWRDGARLKAHLFESGSGKPIETFELKIGDILTQAGINLNEILSDALPGPAGWVLRHLK